MGRRVYIVSKETEVDQAVIDAATSHNCPEIAKGIPPALKGIVTKAMLPCTYEESEPEFIPEPRNIEAEMDEIKAKIADYDDLKARVKTLEGKVPL